jgi:hypothetical protein
MEAFFHINAVEFFVTLVVTHDGLLEAGFLAANITMAATERKRGHGLASVMPLHGVLQDGPAEWSQRLAEMRSIVGRFI